MSREWFSKWWILTKEQLAELQKYDQFIKNTSKITRSRVMANYLVSGLYVKYCMIVQEMDSCLDQMAQVQKSVTMRKLMDAAVTRLRELKELLKEIDLSEIHYVDGSLIESKLIPYDIEILNPSLIFPRPEHIQQMWERIQKGERLFTPPTPPPTPPPEKVDSLERLLQGTPSESKPEEKPPEEKPPEQEPEKQQEPPPEQEHPKEEKKHKKKPVKKFVLEPKVLTEEEVEFMKKKEERNAIVKLIQSHERARQARLYVMDRRRVKAKLTDRSTPKKETPPDPEIMNKAATEFQKLYRGYTARKDIQRRELARRYLIGMVSPSWRSHEEIDKVQKTIERRREIVRQHIRDFIEANITEKDRVMRVVAPGLMEDIGDEIREWFYQWYIRARCFDKIPPPEKGGTVLIVRCETFTPEEYLVEVERKRREKEQNKGKDKAKLEAEKKKKEAEKKKQEQEKKAKEKEAKLKAKKKKITEFEFKFQDSPANKNVEHVMNECKRLWSARKDEDNPEDNVYIDLVIEQQCYEMQLEVRAKVDEMMRIELDLLNEALAFDKAKGKKRKGKKGKNKGKKGKGKKGKRGKKNKDMTGNRSTEDLFQELVDNGIIHTYPVTHLSEFRGDMSYSNWEKRNDEYDPPAALGDIRQAITLTCILPIGVEHMLKRPRSVLIAGPRKSGKHLLANAIFTETKCVLFDLSPPILAGKYDGKKNMKLLVHLINKMSRLLQPSVIFIDGAEKPFYKKVPAAEKKEEPKKMGKQLFKGIVKTIKPEDRVLVLGITRQPWAAKAAGLKKAFEKVILIPRTDYGSAYLYLYELLMRYHGVNRNIEISCLAKLAVNYPMGILKEIVETLMQPRRIMQLSYKPLHQMELYNLMIKHKEGPVSDKDHKKFVKWYNKTPLGKQKAALMKIVEKRREMEAAQAEKQKKKK
ncbi:hypothetical protein MML48_2g00000914 [Holotrichia oblita]|uniref:Uncharacterized protein n=1 Tax=Holotrichia oblita TaxID=644536 RepID=A0ACB9TLV0_HOLOL|nr:hypothetical protein MML48_2g00000914 [Holotrichia oblita]